MEIGQGFGYHRCNKLIKAINANAVNIFQKYISFLIYLPSYTNEPPHNYCYYEYSNIFDGGMDPTFQHHLKAKYYTEGFALCSISVVMGTFL